MKPHAFTASAAGPLCAYREGGLVYQVCKRPATDPIHNTQTITTEHFQHLDEIKRAFVEQVEQKYLAGVRQHGGKLWEKPGLIEKAMEECVDQYTFLYTLKMQRDNPGMIDPNAKDIDE